MYTSKYTFVRVCVDVLYANARAVLSSPAPSAFLFVYVYIYGCLSGFRRLGSSVLYRRLYVCIASLAHRIIRALIPE